MQKNKDFFPFSLGAGVGWLTGYTATLDYRQQNRLQQTEDFLIHLLTFDSSKAISQLREIRMSLVIRAYK